MPQRVTIPCADLARRYNAGESTTQLAREYHCSPTTVAKLLRVCGIEVRDARFQPVALDEQVLRKMYIEQRLPIAMIAERLKVSVTTVGNKRRQYGIPPRSRDPLADDE